MSYEETLDDDQRNAIALDDALVLAGPGAGKTRTLIAKAIKEYEEGREVFVVTFTVSAAEEIRRRIEAQLSIGQMWIGTLHAFALSIMHDAGMHLEIADEPTLNNISLDVRKRLSIKIASSRATEILNGAAAQSIAEQVFVKAVDLQLAEAQLVTYSGILQKALELLRKLPATSRWLLGAVYLIDEVQDSGPIDLDIYDCLQAQGAHLWAVGDLQQSIFGFRNFRRVDVWDWWNNKELRVCELRTNYRSRKAVVSACNVINERFVPRVEGECSDPPTEGCPPMPYPTGLVSVNQQAGEIAMQQQVTYRVKKLIARHSFQFEVRNAIAVLCRTNGDCERIAAFLESEGVSIRKRRKDAPNRVPERLWAALSMFVHPESDWRARRWLLIECPERVADIESTARRTMEPLIKYEFPRLLTTSRQPIDWPEWMGLLGVPDAEQKWFYSRVGEEWEAQAWDEIMLRLFESAPDEEEGSGVTVCTIHAAKGREWRHVLMVYCDDKSYRAENGVEEERVFFVGASRAIETLTLYCSELRYDKWLERNVSVTPCTALSGLISGVEQSKVKSPKKKRKS